MKGNVDRSLRIGERFLLGFKGTTVPAWLQEFAEHHGLGGAVLFDYDGTAKQYGNNVRDPEQVRALCGEIGTLPGQPLIAVDQEGGRVRRLKESLGFAPLPSAADFQELPVEDQRQIARTSFAELRRLGIHWNLAPVIDLNVNPDNPDIGAHGRAYSDQPQAVEETVSLLDSVAREVGLALCLKHYPGLGAATTDTHREFTDLTGKVSEPQLALFHRLGASISGGAVMLSHGIVRDWDAEHPVSISPAAVHRLREVLPDGLLVTDDMQMNGLRALFDLETAATLVLRADVDLILIGNVMRDEQAEMGRLARHLTRLVAGEPALGAAHERALARIQARKTQFVRPLGDGFTESKTP